MTSLSVVRAVVVTVVRFQINKLLVSLVTSQACARKTTKSKISKMICFMEEQ